MKTIVTILSLIVSAVLFTGCTTIDREVRKIPGFEFKSWSHSDRYGVFTDTVVAAGAKWTLNSDGSATLTLDHYDGSAAWAGAVGPHDSIENLVVTFPPLSPQAVALSAALRPGSVTLRQ